MDLILDIGNTFTKLYFFEASNLVKTFTVKNYESFEEITEFNNISRCIIASTGSDSFWKDFLTKRKIAFITMSKDLKLPVVLDYKTPESLGNDRLAAVCGAKFLFPNQNVLIIDAGTAITYDILRKDGKYLGGNISPGIIIRYKSLNTFTKRLPLIDFRLCFSGIGKSTEDAIHKGIQFGVLAEAQAYITEWKTKLGELKVIFTGGDSQFFDNSFKSNIFVMPELVAVGLKSLLEINA